MKFEELTDCEWEFIKPLLPTKAPTGRPRANDRKTINGLLYILITGCKWMDLPREYGSYATAWRRLKRWEKEGVWKKILDALRDRAYKTGLISLESASVDSKTVPAKKGANTSVTTGTR